MGTVVCPSATRVSEAAFTASWFASSRATDAPAAANILAVAYPIPCCSCHKSYSSTQRLFHDVDPFDERTSLEAPKREGYCCTIACNTWVVGNSDPIQITCSIALLHRRRIHIRHPKTSIGQRPVRPLLECNFPLRRDLCGLAPLRFLRRSSRRVPQNEPGLERVIPIP